MEEAGHTPHLEQPDVTADAIAAFVRGAPIAGDADVSDAVAAAERWRSATEAARKAADAAADVMGRAAKAAAEKARGWL